MSRLPILALVAALVIATSVTILIHVIPRGAAAPPVVYPDTSFTAIEGSYTVYAYSADDVSVSSNVTASFYIAGLPMLPYIALSEALPPNASVALSYYDPLAGSNVDAYVYTDSAGKVYYRMTGYASYGRCTVSLIGSVPAIVYTAGAGTVIVVPDYARLVVVAGDSGVNVYYPPVGNSPIITCAYALSYDDATGYSHRIGSANKAIMIGGKSISAVVRPIAVAAVKPAADARITITAS